MSSTALQLSTSLMNPASAAFLDSLQHDMFQRALSADFKTTPSMSSTALHLRTSLMNPSSAAFLDGKDMFQRALSADFEKLENAKG
jgi:hypothetical protein